MIEYIEFAQNVSIAILFQTTTANKGDFLKQNFTIHNVDVS